MRFQPKTEEQIERENLCAPGKYPFTIKSAEEKTDKNNEPFFGLKLFVHADDGRDWHVYDNVSPVWMAHKLRHLAYGTGLAAKYEAGTLTSEDLVGRQGWADVEVQGPQKGYSSKNIIHDYVKDAAQVPRPKSVEETDTPF